MIYTLEEIRSRTLPIIQKYHIPAMYLFGSYARGQATEGSDLDFLVDTTGTDLTSLLRLGALYCDLEDAFEKRIDLITVRSIMQNTDMPSDVDFRNAVLKERVRLDAVA
ncbi:MAG: nucleotidyltransferase family protein [Candidatus Avoscillospira sp.]